MKVRYATVNISVDFIVRLPEGTKIGDLNEQKLRAAIRKPNGYLNVGRPVVVDYHDEEE